MYSKYLKSSTAVICAILFFVLTDGMALSRTHRHKRGRSHAVKLDAMVKTPFRFIAYGDTRFTSSANTKAADPEVRRQLVRAIADARPSFITFGGDITYNGNDPNDWKVYDDETSVWRERGIRVYPALGNHDLHGDQKVALANYFARFPGLRHSRFYSVRAANTLMLTLDSSLDEVSGPQGSWLRKRLDHIPAATDFVFVVLHHPPYTSSSDDKTYGGGHSQRPAEQRLAAYLEQQQKRLRARIVVFSGHVHNYERHEHGGVTYFVTGGGGAHAYPITRAADDPFQSQEVNYHYLLAEVRNGKVTVTMNRLEMKDGVPKWTQPDSVTISAPAR
ncbi:MAG TPA: metallophosphoesterase [Blastocatellia bacterium]|nr:metallophosphoesterase [Blastocatellia bacterium]